MDAKYLTYNAFDLAAEPAFQAWAQIADQAARWEQWLQQHPEQAEKVAEAKELLHVLQIKSVDTSDINKEQLWNKIDAATPAAEAGAPKLAKRRSLPWIAWAAAAGLALLIGIPFLTGSLTEVNTGYATMEKTQLPDQSIVHLNADSRITFSEKKWQSERTVQLEGEAFFEVQKGEKFTVKTPNGNVQVLGTSFNVLSRGDQFSVICKTGKVAVQKNGQELILTPGESAEYTASGKLVKSKTPNAGEVDWMAGIYRFENAPLSEVMQSIERQFDYSVNLPKELESKAYTGLFQTNALDSALYQITWPLNLKYKVENKRIVIYH